MLNVSLWICYWETKWNLNVIWLDLYQLKWHGQRIYRQEEITGSPVWTMLHILLFWKLVNQTQGCILAMLVMTLEKLFALLKCVWKEFWPCSRLWFYANSLPFIHWKITNVFFSIFSERKIPPSFTKKPSPAKEDAEGSEVKLEARLAGSPPLNIRWLKDNKEISSSDNIHISFKSNVALLCINPARNSDSGNYMCEASNEAGMVTCYVKVTITGRVCVCLIWKSRPTEWLNWISTCSWIMLNVRIGMYWIQDSASDLAES